jgi:CHAT domain-containing protein
VYTGADRVCISDFAVSSYTPSLSTIIKTRKDFLPISRDRLKALLVAEPAAVGFEPLPKAEDEVWTIDFLLGGAAIERQVRIAPTVQTVLDSLSSAHVLHLACHGVQRKDALESHFVLDDGPLTIAMLSRLDLPNAVLAFLSACETAKGDQNQPDQAVHLAASMLFCGFRSVIGTMW